MAENLKKVVCLYRVSTKKQVDDNDIPMQKESCRDFINRQDNWVLSKEYFEKGVSGFKKYAAQRDVLQQVRQDAVNHKFNILLVFMFDRLGRKEDETPFIVEWFTQQGIEVWSVKEGQQKFEHHVDKLMNYIRFWQASGESEKTSIRVDTKLRQMAHEGLFHGGTPPYGYHLIPSGIYNKKKKELLKMEIDEEQSKVVKQIYDYVTQYGYGRSRIAQALNNQHIKTISGVNWNPSTIATILKNPIYKGLPAYGKRSNKSGSALIQPKSNWVYSDKPIQDLIIIDSEQWDKVQKITKCNCNVKLSNVSNKVTKSPCLFVGKIFCGYCHSPLTTTYNYRWNSKKTIQYKYVKYRCSGKASKCIPCQGKTVYSAPIIEKTVLHQTFEYLQQIYDNHYDPSKSKKSNIKQLKKEITNIEHKILQYNKEYDTLLQEVSKSLMGNSVFKPEMLSSLIEQKEKEIQELNDQKDKLQSNCTDENNNEDCYKTLKDIIINWDDYFNSLQFDRKKILLRSIIDRIIVYKDSIDIRFVESPKQFLYNYKEIKKVVD